MNKIVGVYWISAGSPVLKSVFISVRSKAWLLILTLMHLVMQCCILRSVSVFLLGTPLCTAYFCTNLHSMTHSETVMSWLMQLLWQRSGDWDKKKQKQNTLRWSHCSYIHMQVNYFSSRKAHIHTQIHVNRSYLRETCTHRPITLFSLGHSNSWTNW